MAQSFNMNSSGYGFQVPTVDVMSGLNIPDYQSPNYSLAPNVNSPTGLKISATDFLPDLAKLGTDTTPGGGSFWDSLGSFFKSATGTKDNPGWGGMALGTLAGLANMYMGMKQYGLAKNSLNENKRQFDLNYEAQKNLTNSQLADRQMARNLASPGMYDSPETYLAKYGVK